MFNIVRHFGAPLLKCNSPPSGVAQFFALRRLWLIVRFCIAQLSYGPGS